MIYQDVSDAIVEGGESHFMQHDESSVDQISGEEKS